MFLYNNIRSQGKRQAINRALIFLFILDILQKYFSHTGRIFYLSGQQLRDLVWYHVVKKSTWKWLWTKEVNRNGHNIWKRAKISLFDITFEDSVQIRDEWMPATAAHHHVTVNTISKAANVEICQKAKESTKTAFFFFSFSYNYAPIWRQRQT